jgi:hypothetical protein
MGTRRQSENSKSKMLQNLGFFEHHVGPQKVLDFRAFWVLNFWIRDA